MNLGDSLETRHKRRLRGRLGVTLAILLALLVSVPSADSRPRKGLGHQHHQGAASPPPSWIENVPPLQLIASNGYRTGGNQNQVDAIAAGDNKIFVGYQDNAGNADGTGAHNIVVKMYDYATGLWTGPTIVATKDPMCCDGHEAPAVILTPTGIVEVYYSGVQAGTTPTHGNGPFTRKSLAPYSITSGFDTEVRVPLPGSITESNGGYDILGGLHLFGQCQTGKDTVGTLREFDLCYVRRASETGSWNSDLSKALVSDANTGGSPPSGQQGEAGCVPSGRVIGTTLHVVFARSMLGSACNNDFADLFYVKSSGGSTWTNAAGGSPFTPPLVGTVTKNVADYPSTYRVYQGSDVKQGWSVSALADGTPVIAFRTSSALRFAKWTGSTWTLSSIDTGSAGSAGVSIIVTSTDKILVYAPRTGHGEMREWASTDGGSTWTHTVLRMGRNSWPVARRFDSLAAKERVIVAWNSQITNATNIYLMDRPQ